jgi:uncharacterized membrane protein YbhN (UPF0104 family)
VVALTGVGDSGISETKSGRRWWSWALAGIIAAVLLFYTVRGVDWRQVVKTLAGARWEFLAGACITISCALLLRALRWRIPLSAEARLDFPLVFRATMAGYLANNFLPARAGEVIRSLVISRRSTLSTSYVLTTALSERLIDAVTLVLWSSLILTGSGAAPPWMKDMSRTIAVMAAAGGLAIAILPHAETLCRAILLRLPVPETLRGALLRLTTQVLLGLRAFHHVGRFLGFGALTAVIWTMDALTSMMVGRSLGLPVTFPIAMLLVAGLGLGSALPSTPGYIGIYQFVGVSVLTPFGMGRDGALAYVLMLQALGYFMILLLGLPCLYWIQRSRPPEAHKGPA